jgi:anti-sigma factor RsiW
MNCGEIKSLLHPYNDGELDLVACAKVNEHLAHCKDCQAQLNGIQALRQALRRPELTYKLPEGLEKRVFKAIQNERSPGFRFPDFLSIRSLSWVTALLLVTSSLLFLRQTGKSPEDELAQEVVSEHVRSIMTGHLFEVASSDKHTVKPWFIGKLDFSPTVKDLASANFPLVGGRVDYLSGQPVAALVYQHGKHVINLFIWPATGSESEGVNSFSIRGFYIFKWAKEGFRYWTISDLNPTDLTEFMQLYRKP